MTKSSFPICRSVLLADPATEPPMAIASPPPRVLMVTPEIADAPEGLSPRSHLLTAKAGGLADVSACLIKGLQTRGANVHLAMPNYRQIFNFSADDSFKQKLAESALPDSRCRVHLAEDRSFYYRSHIYGGPEATHAAVAFQREVLNNIITKVRPNLIHCHDWMTGLVPALAKAHGIPCLMTIHNIHTERLTLEHLEHYGIDAASFWQNLYYDRQPYNYEETRSHNPCDLLASGILAADHVNVVSPNFLSEIRHGFHECVPHSVRTAIRIKAEAGQASGITNSPDASYNPSTDPHLRMNYSSSSVVDGKVVNKLTLQRQLGLQSNPDAPVLFWPSRLDPQQKGCQLLTDLLFQTIADYDYLGLQIVAVANGPYECHLHEIIGRHGIQHRVASVNFDEGLSRLAFAGSDFVLMPSLFEPCGLPQMIGPRYGTLPIARNTGGLHDTVTPINVETHEGTGFLFDHYDAGGLRWAIDQALFFYQQHPSDRFAHIKRVMDFAMQEFNDHVMCSKYFQLYEQILKRPLISRGQHTRPALTSPLPSSRDRNLSKGERNGTPHWEELPA